MNRSRRLESWVPRSRDSTWSLVGLLRRHGSQVFASREENRRPRDPNTAAVYGGDDRAPLIEGAKIRARCASLSTAGYFGALLQKVHAGAWVIVSRNACGEISCQRRNARENVLGSE